MADGNDRGNVLPGGGSNYLNVSDDDASECTLICGLGHGREFRITVPGRLSVKEAKGIVDTIRFWKPIYEAVADASSSAS